MVDEQQDNFDDSLLDRAMEAAFDPAPAESNGTAAISVLELITKMITTTVARSISEKLLCLLMLLFPAFLASGGRQFQSICLEGPSATLKFDC